MSKKTKTPLENIPLNYGGIQLQRSNKQSPYIPTNGGKFVENGEMLKHIAIGIRDNLPVLIIGESGVGKTAAIRYIAAETNNGLRRVNLNGGTTADELVGRLLINDKGTYWVDGILTEAMRNGDFIVLDEINSALPEVLFVLQSVLDDDGYLVLTEKDDKEIVHKHPDFRLFATCNPPDYAGVKDFNKALLSRFAICISANFPPAATELTIIEHHLGNAIAKSEIAGKLIELATETRKSKELGTADYAINTRDVLNTLKLAQFMEPIDALSLAFGNKLETTDNKALKMMSKLYLPSKKKEGKILEQVKTDKDMKIGSTYILNEDIKDMFTKLTKEETEITNLKDQNLGKIMTSSLKTDGIKGQEFIVEAIYYSGSNGAQTTEEGNEEYDKLGSIVTITSGKTKGITGIILHHERVNAAHVLNGLSEVC